MLNEQLLTELHKLDRTQKLRVVQLLVNDLASDEALLDETFPPGTVYDLPSPHDAFGAAQQMQAILDMYKRDHDHS